MDAREKEELKRAEAFEAEEEEEDEEPLKVKKSKETNEEEEDEEKESEEEDKANPLIEDANVKYLEKNLKKEYNGGGHVGAAGCQITEAKFKRMLKTKTI